MEKLLKVLLFVALFIAMWLSRTYALTPEEFAKKEWANPHLISELSDACKTAIDPIHCFGIWLSISRAESQMGNDPKAINHWYFGRVWSKDKSAYWFVNTYKRKYYIVDKYNEWWMFYWYSPSKPAPTSYCMSERQPNGKLIEWHCPLGRKSFNFIYDKYKQEVMNQTIAKVDNPKLIKAVASKEPIKTTGKRCKIIYRAERDGYIQIDRFQNFRNWIRWVKKNDAVFRCYDIK